MNGKKLILSTLVIFLSFSWVLNHAVSSQNSSNYPKTISAIQELYMAEITAYKAYSAFAQKAFDEKYVSVARLFSALSQSEYVHARNFKNILNDLGVEPKKFPEPNIRVRNTKRNLKWALNVELSEIDTNYPKIIKLIKPEGNERALTDITYAWKAEMQHRDLIRKMKSALRLFFGKIVDRLKEAHEYHVCQRCGSTVFELPDKSCVICGSPVSMYKEVK